MGFWNDGVRSRSNSPSRRSSSKHHSSSQREGPYSRPTYARSASSFISNLTGYDARSVDDARRKERSREHERERERDGRSTSRGLFGFGSSNYYSKSYGSSRARPRSGLVAKIKRWLQKLYAYMRRHPVRTFMLVIMPLLTGGVLTKLLATVGVRLPRSMEQMLGGSMNRGLGGGERYYARGGARDFAGGSMLPGIAGAGESAGGLMQSAAGLMKVARMFV